MKLKELFFMFGLKPAIKTFGHQLCKLDNPLGGAPLTWARWMHPKVAKLEPYFKDIPFLTRILRPGDVAIDIGAHVGDTTIPIGLVVGPTGLVIALEPNPATFKILEINAAQNTALLNIHPVNAAAMDVDGNYEFHYNDPGLANGGYRKGFSIFQVPAFFTVNVKGINLPSYISQQFPDSLNRIRYIKTDCEGHDYEVFRGLKTLVNQARPFITMEIFDQVPLAEEKALIRELQQMNYLAYKIKSLGDLQFSLIDLATHEKQKDNYDLLAVPQEKQGELFASTSSSQ